MSAVLVVDDDMALVRALGLVLRRNGWDVLSAPDGRRGLDLAVRERPDVVVLDLGLPDGDGIAVLRQLRRRSDVPVLVLSARQESAEKVAALDAGADDYVPKPFAVEELLARLRAAVRRSGATDEGVVTAGDLEVDLGGGRVRRGGREVRLTPTEWLLLVALVRRRGRLVGHRELLQAVWGPSYGSESHYLRVYAAQLRRKLERDPSAPQHIVTEPGLGYRFETDDHRPGGGR